MHKDKSHLFSLLGLSCLHDRSLTPCRRRPYRLPFHYAHAVIFRVHVPPTVPNCSTKELQLSNRVM